MQNTLQSTGEPAAGFEPGMAEKIQQSLAHLIEQQKANQQPAALVVQPLLRSALVKFVRNISSDLHVLSYQEVPEDKQIRIVGTVG